MNHNPLMVDIYFFKDNSADDTAKALSYLKATKRVDKSILTVDYEAKTSKRVGILDIGSTLIQKMNIKQDEALGVQKYSFSVTKGFIQVKMNKAIDVNSTFTMNGRKCDDKLVAINMRDVVATTDKLRVLNVNDFASPQEVKDYLNLKGLEVNNVLHEKYPTDVPLFESKQNGNMVAWIKREESNVLLSQVKIRGVSALLI